MLEGYACAGGTLMLVAYHWESFVSAILCFSLVDDYHWEELCARSLKMAWLPRIFKMWHPKRFLVVQN